MAVCAFTSYRAGAGLVIVAPGEVDLSNQQQLEDIGVRALLHGPVVVDFAATNFLAISALRVLVRTQRVSVQTGCPFVLAAVSSSVLDLLSLAELRAHFRISPSVEAAQRAAQGGFERFADK